MHWIERVTNVVNCRPVDDSRKGPYTNSVIGEELGFQAKWGDWKASKKQPVSSPSVLTTQRALLIWIKTSRQPRCKVGMDDTEKVDTSKLVPDYVLLGVHELWKRIKLPGPIISITSGSSKMLHQWRIKKEHRNRHAVLFSPGAKSFPCEPHGFH